MTCTATTEQACFQVTSHECVCNLVIRQVPTAGDEFYVCEDESMGRKAAEVAEDAMVSLSSESNDRSSADLSLHCLALLFAGLCQLPQAAPARSDARHLKSQRVLTTRQTFLCAALNLALPGSRSALMVLSDLSTRSAGTESTQPCAQRSERLAAAAGGGNIVTTKSWVSMDDEDGEALQRLNVILKV